MDLTVKNILENASTQEIDSKSICESTKKDRPKGNINWPSITKLHCLR